MTFRLTRGRVPQRRSLLGFRAPYPADGSTLHRNSAHPNKRMLFRAISRRVFGLGNANCCQRDIDFPDELAGALGICRDK